MEAPAFLDLLVVVLLVQVTVAAVAVVLVVAPLWAKCKALRRFTPHAEDTEGAPTLALPLLQTQVVAVVVRIAAQAPTEDQAS